MIKTDKVPKPLGPLKNADLERDAVREQYAKQLPMFCEFFDF